MRSLVKEVAIGVILIFILSNIINMLRKPELESSTLPKIETVLLDGSRFTVKADKPLVIHFWATWCRVCKLEAANIERLSKKYEVLTIAVNSGSDREIEAYLKERGLTFSVVNDRNGSWAKTFKVDLFPTTFIYDARGELKFTETGYTTTAGLLARLKMVE
jgi:thiol-disulfide isomerase/thioredoxin